MGFLKSLVPCLARSPWGTRCILAKGHNKKIDALYHGDINGELWT